MKILLIMASPGPLIGGMEKQTAIQANELSRRAEVHVIAADSYKDLFSPEVNFIGCNMSRSRRNPFFMFELYSRIKLVAPDVVHAHGHKAASQLAALKPCFKNISLIATAHGLKKKNKMLAKMDHVICVSKGIKERVGQPNSHVIYNGISPFEGDKKSKEALCSLFSIDPKNPLIVALGRLAPVKRYDALIEAMEGLEANLLLIGDGPELETLKSKACNNVIFAGYRSDARSLLAGADLMVISSEREGFSLAMIESLQLEVPVISTRVPGAEDFLPPQCLIDDVDARQIRDTLMKVINDLPKHKASMQAVFEKAKQELTLENNVAQTYAIYEMANTKTRKNEAVRSHV